MDLPSGVKLAQPHGSGSDHIKRQRGSFFLRQSVNGSRELSRSQRHRIPLLILVVSVQNRHDVGARECLHRFDLALEPLSDVVSILCHFDGDLFAGMGVEKPTNKDLLA